MLLGRGKGTATRPGNRLYRILLHANGLAYASSNDKMAFTKRFLQEVQTFGRFVENIGSSHYVEISDKSARVIVAQVRSSLDLYVNEKPMTVLLPISFVSMILIYILTGSSLPILGKKKAGK